MSRIEPKAGGTWRQVAVVVDGNDFAVGRATLLTVEESEFTVTVNGRTFMKGTTRVVSEGTPRQSDALVERGPNAGKTLRQIGTIEGDVLVACAGPPDGERPTEFTSERGSGRSLSVWLRVQPGDAARYRSPTAGWQFLVFLLFVVSAADGAEALKKDLGASLGYWGALAASVGAGAGLLTGVCLLLRWGWRAGLALGVSTSLAVNTFPELKAAITPALGAPGAIAVSGATALVMGWVAWVLLARLLKMRD